MRVLNQLRQRAVRVVERPPLVRKAPRDGGVTIIYVALTMLMIMGAGAVAVDGGMMWRERRDLVADVDSAALAGAEIAAQNCDVGGTWTTLANTHPVYLEALQLVDDNQGGGADPAAFTVEMMCLDTERGKVRVRYVGALEPFFSSVYGFSDLAVENQSTVQFEPHDGGLRPISICVDDGSAANDIVNELWLDSPPGTKLTTSLGKTWKAGDFGLASSCGTGGSGSWGWVCFDKDAPETSCASSDLPFLLLEGWPYNVDLGDPPPATPPPYTGIEANNLPLNGWSDYDCKIRSSPSAGGTNNACDTHTGNTSSSNIQDAFDAINCDLDAFGNLLATPLDADDCQYQFPILGIWELAGSGSGAILKPSTFVVVTLRHPSYVTQPKNSDPGGKFACGHESNHPTSSSWLNDPPVWDNNRTCITLELVDQYWYGDLYDHDFIGNNTRLCGVDDDPNGDRCDF